MYEEQLDHTSTAWVHDALEADQLSSAKLQYNRRTLNKKTALLLWALRAYALIMIVLVIFQITNTIGN